VLPVAFHCIVKGAKQVLNLHPFRYKNEGNSFQRRALRRIIEHGEFSTMIKIVGYLPPTTATAVLRFLDYSQETFLPLNDAVRQCFLQLGNTGGCNFSLSGIQES
jgi:hypothetical protein